MRCRAQLVTASSLVERVAPLEGPLPLHARRWRARPARCACSARQGAGLARAPQREWWERGAREGREGKDHNEGIASSPEEVVDLLGVRIVGCARERV